MPTVGAPILLCTDDKNFPPWTVISTVSMDCHLDRSRRIPRKRDSFAEWRDPENVSAAMPTQGIRPQDRPPHPQFPGAVSISGKATRH